MRFLYFLRKKTYT